MKKKKKKKKKNDIGNIIRRKIVAVGTYASTTPFFSLSFFPRSYFTSHSRVLVYCPTLFTTSACPKTLTTLCQLQRKLICFNVVGTLEG